MSESPRNTPSHRIEWLVWGGLAITVIAIAVAFVRTRLEEASLSKPLDVIGQVPPFSLTNQFGNPWSLSNLIGSVWVADVIFTRCPISCEKMTQRMKVLTAEVPARADVKFVSITADPDYDTPAVLTRYAEERGLNQQRWHFLTGLKPEVYALSVGGLKFAVLDNEDKTIPDNFFVHSTQFALVDRHGRIRGYFEGTDDRERKQLAVAVKKLLREK
jgi:protein SCO1/2